MSNYATFLERKQRVFRGSGIEHSDLSPMLYPWQAAITRWALKKGRAALFEDCGLGKTFQSVGPKWYRRYRSRLHRARPVD